MVHGSLFEFALELFPTGRRSLATTCLLWSMPRVQKVTLVPVGTIEFRFGVVHVCIDNGRVIQSSKYESTLDHLAQHSWQPTDQPAWLTPEWFTAKISPCYRMSRCPPFDRHSESRNGMRAKFAKDTDRIQGTGARWRRWSESMFGKAEG
jgi:hypothetical protein